MPVYASPEQFMRDRSEYARKGIGRGRSVVVTTYSAGVLFVAENHSPTLHKVSEIYDRIGLAAVGRYNEFENLRTAGIRLADVRGYSYDRRDVTARWLANAYAQTLGSIFSEHQKPYEVELCVAEVARSVGEPVPAPGETRLGAPGQRDQLYRISFDGSIMEETRYVVMGGVTEPVASAMEKSFRAGWDLPTALAAAVSALGAGGEGAPRKLESGQLEVAVLDRTVPERTFRRLDRDLLDQLLTPPSAEPAATPAEPTEPAESAEPVGPAEAADAAPADTAPEPGPPADEQQPDH
nr:proteasome subunit alpha [Nakamurella panacisegetis]